MLTGKFRTKSIIKIIATVVKTLPNQSKLYLDTFLCKKKQDSEYNNKESKRYYVKIIIR